MYASPLRQTNICASLLRNSKQVCAPLYKPIIQKFCMVLNARTHVIYITYTRKNAQVATELQTSCNKSVDKLLTRCIRTACSEFVGTSLEQAVDKL